MYRKALVNGKFLYFVHAPPQTELDKKPERKRPAPPDPKEPLLYASVYYYWWAFLRLNGDYLACCERGGKGKMASVYKNFGDVRDGRRKSTEKNRTNTPVDEFREWWIKKGAELFAEPQTSEENLNALAEENLRVDAELLESLKRLGVITTQYDLSRLCGMNESYYSSMRAKGYGMNLGSLVFLWGSLSHRAREVSEPKISAVLSHAAGLVHRAVTEKCRLRELEIKAARGR